MLKGALVRLRSIEPSDYVVLAEWLNQQQVMSYWGLPGNTVSVGEVARQEETNASRPDSHKYMIESQDGKSIGQIDYYDLNWQARNAWVSILIGDSNHWGGGYGTDAMRTLLSYLFQQLGLHRVTLTVHAFNERAIRSYEKNGFKKEGTLRDWAFFDGRWVDGIVMSVLDDDFPSPESV